MKGLIRTGLLLSTGFSIAVSGNAFAQDASGNAAEAGETDIIVTARKRDETSLVVPVTITAVGAAELQRRAINSVDALARVVPSLIAGEGGGTVQGGIIAIRGISGADNNPFNDQAVSFNIDGVAIGRASVRRLSDMDIQQIEVLKGPQALYFGKNSPGGIISIRTADPTSTFEAKISQGYEFRAREWRTEGYISGPITDSLGIRVAGFLSDMQGWAKNYTHNLSFANSNTAGGFVFPYADSRAPKKTDWSVRGTMKFDDGGPFDARLKVNYAQVHGAPSSANTQYVSCPLGIPQQAPPLSTGLPADNCKADDKVGSGDFAPNNLHAFNPVFPENGRSYLRQYQILASYEMNYHLNDSLTLTSVSGYYRLHLRNLGNFTQNYFEGPAAIYNNPAPNPAAPGTTLPTLGPVGILRQQLPSLNFLDLKEYSQELRLASDFDGPVDFMLGGLYGHTYGRNGSITARNTSGFVAPTLANPNPVTVLPSFVNNYLYVQKGFSYSIFGQMNVDFTDQLQLSVGARYSYEKKRLPLLASASAAAPLTLVALNPPTLRREVSFNNLSPEFTLSYRPDSNINIYGSYKEGFLSGGYAAVVPSATSLARPAYNQQITRGYEGGIKGKLFDNTVRVNLSAYNYKTNGLQVGVTVEGVNPVLTNAGSVRAKGIDFDINYRTPIDGLSFNAAVNYNKAYYLSYFASCYRGQPSASCFLQFNPITGSNALAQNLAGAPLVRAPRWTGNVGFNYETAVGGALKLGISGNASHSDKYFTDTTNAPGGLQRGYELYDATIRVSPTDDRWELAFIGRNLTNTHYFVRSSDTPFTGTGPGCNVAPGAYATSIGCGNSAGQTPLLGDTAASVSRGRELMLRVSYKFGRD